MSLNDSLADAAPLFLNRDLVVDVTDATLEVDETMFAGYYKSIWYRYTPVHDMLLGVDSLSGVVAGARWWLCMGTGYDDLTILGGPLQTWPTSKAVALTAGQRYFIRVAATDSGETELTVRAQEYEWSDWTQDGDEVVHSASPAATVDLLFSGTEEYSAVDSNILAKANELTSAAFVWATGFHDPADDTFITDPTTGSSVPSGTTESLHQLAIAPVHVTPGDEISVHVDHLGFGVHLAPLSTPEYVDVGSLEYELPTPRMVAAEIVLNLSYGMTFSHDFSGDVSGTAGHMEVDMYLLAANNNLLHHPYARRPIYDDAMVNANAGFATPTITTLLDEDDLADWVPGDGVIFYTRMSTLGIPVFTVITVGDSDAVHYNTQISPEQFDSVWTYRPPRWREQLFVEQPPLVALAGTPPRRIFPRSDGATQGAPRVLRRVL